MCIRDRALHEAVELVVIQLFALPQQGRKAVQLIHVSHQNILGAGVALFQQIPHFPVDESVNLFGEAGILLIEGLAQEHLVLAAQIDGADLFAHAVFGDHAPVSYTHLESPDPDAAGDAS